MTGDERGRLGENLLVFCRTLRRAGLPVGTGQVIDAAHAAIAVGLHRRDDFYHALRAVLVTDPAHYALFRQAFYVHFSNPRLLERMMTMLLPHGMVVTDGETDTARRLLQALATPGEEQQEDAVTEVDRSASWSHREILRHKDFEQMTLAEQAEARDMLREEMELLRKIATRRYEACASGNRYDLRRTMHAMMRNNGQLVDLARKRSSVRAPVLVLLCDISGSMSRYSRMFLHFAHALRISGQTMHTFVFGTRLTNIGRRLRDRDPDRALAAIAADVADWDGGTRIAESLARFNKDWARRVLAQNSVVVLLSDGLERDTGSDLEFQMLRLRRSCRQLVWLNPVLRYAGFEPKAAGIRKMLPHVDLFLPAHNLESLADLHRVLRRGVDGKASSRPDSSHRGAAA